MLIIVPRELAGADAAGGTVLTIFKKDPDPELLVRGLFRTYITEQAMWDAVCSLEPYTAPTSVAACETAFAHLAILQRICGIGRSDEVVARIAAIVGDIVEEGFPVGNEETSSFYRGFLLEDLPLGRVARLSVSAYYQRAFRSDLVARIMCGRIGCSADKLPVVESTLRSFGAYVSAAVKERRLAA
jgi:hypothetical protein